MTPLAWSVMALGFGFALIVAGSSLFSRSLEKTVERFFENRNRGLRILGNLSLSLPELILPLLAFLTPNPGASRVEAGTGALFGPPLFLCLILIPLSFLLRPPEARSLARETPFILAGLAASLALFGRPFLPRLLLASGLAVVYLWGLLATEDREKPTGPSAPHTSWTLLDGLFLGGGALLMGIGSQLFLVGIEGLQELRGISSFWTALILAPVATEAPELLTLTHFIRRKSLPPSFSILWGSIHLQTTLGIASGLLVSPWKGSPDTLHAGAVLLGVLALLFVVGFSKRRRFKGRDVP